MRVRDLKSQLTRKTLIEKMLKKKRSKICDYVILINWLDLKKAMKVIQNPRTVLIKGVCEQSVEEIIWTENKGSSMRMEMII
jgi:hypothetical protein